MIEVEEEMRIYDWDYFSSDVDYLLCLSDCLLLFGTSGDERIFERLILLRILIYDFAECDYCCLSDSEVGMSGSY